MLRPALTSTVSKNWLPIHQTVSEVNNYQIWSMQEKMLVQVLLAAEVSGFCLKWSIVSIPTLTKHTAHTFILT